MTPILRVLLVLIAIAAACSSPPSDKGSGPIIVIDDNNETNNNNEPNNVMITECGPGRTLCSGACINTTLDSDNCGSCGTACPDQTVCSESSCAQVPDDCRVEGTCPSRYYCDENTGLCAVGCSSNTDCPTGSYCELASRACLCSDEGSVVCGEECVAESPLTCGTSCETCPPITNGEAVCEDGTCGQVCDDGHMMCDGSCAPCPTGDGVVDVACLGNECVASECEAGHEICGGTCAACPQTSGDESLGCEGTTCIITDCPADTRLCDGSCAPCPDDPNGTRTCQGSECVLVCGSGFHSCGSFCAADDDPENCGSNCESCGQDPNGFAMCSSGSCSFDCSDGYRECQGSCAACPDGPGVVSTMCAGGNCVVSSCAAGYQPCSGGCCQPAPDGVAYDYDVTITDVSIAVDSRGYPHIGFASASDNAVYYAWWDGSAWQSEYVTTGWTADIGLDLMERPSLAIWKRGNPDGLWYAHRDASGGWSVEEADRSFNDVGMTPDLVMVGNTPHIAHYDLQNNDLRYAVKSGNSWTDSLVVSNDEVGFSPTMVITSAGEPHIVYRDETNDRTRYSWNDGSWNTVTVDDTFDSGNYSSLGLGAANRLHLAFVGWNFQDGDRVYYTTQQGGAWVAPEYVADGDRPSLVVDDQGRPVIVYLQNTGSTLGMATSVGGWSPVTLDPSPGGEANDAVFDPGTGKVHVVYDNFADDDVKYLTFDP